MGVLGSVNNLNWLYASGIDFLQNAIKIHQPEDELLEMPANNDTFDLLDVIRFNKTEALLGLPKQIDYHDKLLVSPSSTTVWK